MKRIAALILLALTLALGACTDPRSPVRGYQPTLGTVSARTYNTYGVGLTWYYLKVITSSGDWWVEVNASTYYSCTRGDLWSRSLGCRSARVLPVPLEIT